MDKLVGLAGIFLILATCVLFSANPNRPVRAPGLVGWFPWLVRLFAANFERINWRLVGSGIAVQAVLAALILHVPFVASMFTALGDGIQSILDSAKQGAAFVFGEQLVASGFVFLIVIGCSIIFMGALVNLLWHFGIIQWVVKFLAGIMRKGMKVSGVEALSTGAEIFLGQVESQLLISKYIKVVTQSELLGIMSAAMATISGSALVAYVALGVNPTYLLMASFMTAPSALVIAKMLVPETDEKALDRPAELVDERTSVNFVDAIAEGANQGYRVAKNVMVQLIAFIAVVALANTLLGKGLSLVGLSWTIQDIFGVAFTPVAWLIGVPWDEAFTVGKLLGTKTVLNEMIAYMDLMKLADGTLSPRTLMITTIALCGFANLGSVGINIGGLTAMAPERKADIARMGFKALVAATLASWLTAALAGLLMW